jgi:DNA-binding response OmpR family regulator
MKYPVEHESFWARQQVVRGISKLEAREIMVERSILIADDETNLCRILSAELSKAGYSPVIVHDGAQAIEEARKSDFQMVILDVRMPVLDGFSALREIRKFRKDIPIIIMTAYEGHDTVASALSMGATACVSKPFDLESLVALVKATLDEGTGRRSLDWSARIRTVMFNKHQPVLLEIHEGDHTGQHQSTIEDKDDQTLAVACPQGNGGYVILSAGSPVTVGFAGEDAFYTFETTVLAARDGDVPLMVINKPAVIYRVQRRKYPRALARIPVDISVIGSPSVEGNGHEPFRVYTEDIGVGGFKMVTETEIPNGAELDVEAENVPGLTKLSGIGKVIRSRRTAINSHFGWEYAIKFTKMDDEARQALRVMVDTEGND